MKFGSIILALCTLRAANAFVAQHLKTFTHTHTTLNIDNGALYAASDKVSNTYANGSASTIQEQGGSILAKYQGPKTTKELFEGITPVKVQGDTLKTCAFNEDVERVAVYLKTEGRPLNANVELWQGPDNSPQKMSVYLEDGSLRPFHCVLESPGASNSVSIRNTAEMEFPLIAGIDLDVNKQSVSPATILNQNGNARIVQGGAVYTTPFAPAVKSVQVLLKTDGRPLNARIELLQGPNNTKQVMEVYTEDGSARPFFAIIDTPGSGNVIRIVNTNTIEYPLTATVESYMTDENIIDSAPGGMEWR